MRVPVANVAFDDFTMPEAVERIVLMTQKTDRPRYVCTGNLDHLVMLSKDPHFRAVYGVADMVLADGAPIIWLSRLRNRHQPLRERVAGSDLFWELARASAATGLRLFLLGGAPGAAKAAADAVSEHCPGAQVCGTYCPPAECFDTPEEQERIRAHVHDAQPDVLLVAFGAPKQEKWIAEYKDCLGVPVAIGVGGTFEMASGIVRRAPLWVQRAGMEWAYRCLQEPKRLFGRYFLRDLPFLLVLVARSLVSRS
jgi:N-acetylglucosaminyldiphosphoundecaprenol N-acetyl-beta-D-mannosaminyltransferase